MLVEHHAWHRAEEVAGLLAERGLAGLAAKEEEGGMRGVRVDESAAGVDAEELRRRELRRQRDAEQEVVQARHERRQRRVRARFGVDVAFQK